MSRTFTHKTDESTLTTLCPPLPECPFGTPVHPRSPCRPLSAHQGALHLLPNQLCFDYYIQPTSPKSTYFKKGRLDDESECA